ncbi:hypothetical protein RSOL_099360, partial [Rhizoctonia solani AG-3 Rhs1AP]
MAEERTISNFTRLNAPDRGRQKASTLVHMTQIRQHAQREENQGSPAVAPAVHFRNRSDLLKSAGKVSIDLRGTNIPASANAGDIVPVANGSDSVVHEFIVDVWEHEAGDEEIEPAEGGAMDGFEVEAEGVNLGEPLLLDLLSDEPVLGARLEEEIRSKRTIVAAGVDPSLSMGWIVVQESWRLAALIYLFMALCGADPKDARVTKVHAKFIKLYTGVEARRIPDSFLVLPMSIVSQGL